MTLNKLLGSGTRNLTTLLQFRIHQMSSRPLLLPYLTTHISFLLMYIDDVLIARSKFSIEKINNIKKQLLKQFAMMYLGAAKQVIGMRIIRDSFRATLKLLQAEYVIRVLSKFDMDKSKLVDTFEMSLQTQQGSITQVNGGARLHE